jgi:murein DD-endopeptidase MepM/ murein hydrolase activator NlpD
MSRTLLVAGAVAVLAAPAPTLAASPATGGTPASSAPAEQTPSPAAPPSGAGGGTRYGAPVPARKPAERPKPKPKAKPRRATGGPVLIGYAVPKSVYAYGSPARISFQIKGGGANVHVTLSVVRDGRRALAVDLGHQPTGRRVTYLLRPKSRLAEGRYHVHLHALDARGRPLKASADAATSRALAVYSARFPVVGAHSFGGPDARFGAPRSGHIHQGQDVVAAQGTPLVAVRGGIVTAVAYQAAGAGYYVVISGAGTARSYVFMHLMAGSTLVHVGQRVRTGERIGLVGATGDASGPHLHFEIWEGAWYGGGHPIDPLPSLLRWDRYS